MKKYFVFVRNLAIGFPCVEPTVVAVDEREIDVFVVASFLIDERFSVFIGVDLWFSDLPLKFSVRWLILLLFVVLLLFELEVCSCSSTCRFVRCGLLSFDVDWSRKRCFGIWIGKLGCFKSIDVLIEVENDRINSSRREIVETIVSAGFNGETLFSISDGSSFCSRKSLSENWFGSWKKENSSWRSSSSSC